MKKSSKYRRNVNKLPKKEGGGGINPLSIAMNQITNIQKQAGSLVGNLGMSDDGVQNPLAMGASNLIKSGGNPLTAGMGLVTDIINRNAKIKQIEQQQLAKNVSIMSGVNSDLINNTKIQPNVSVFSKGGDIPITTGTSKNNTSVVNKPTDPYHDLLSSARQEILKGGIDNPDLYQDESAPSKYFSALKGDNLDVINPYTQRFIINYNNRYPDHALDPNKIGLAHLEGDKPWTNIPANSVDTLSRNTVPIDYRNPGKYQTQNQDQKKFDVKSRSLGNNALGVYAQGGSINNLEGQPHIINGQQTGGIPLDADGQPVVQSGAQPVAEAEGKESTIKIPNKYRRYYDTGNGSDSNTVVMSEQLKKSGTKSSFADATKRITTKYTKLRPNNDSISENAMHQELGKLFRSQEEMKGDFNNHMSDVTYAAEGGKININPANKGKFIESAKRNNMSSQEFVRHVLANKDQYSSTQIERSNNYTEYAKGGKINPSDVRDFQSQYGLKVDNIVGPKTKKAWSIYGDEFNNNKVSRINPIVSNSVNSSNSYNLPTDKQVYSQVDRQESNIINNKPYTGGNEDLWAGMGVAAANMGLAAFTPKPKTATAPMITAPKIDLSTTREAILRNAKYSRAMDNSTAAKYGLSAGQQVGMRGVNDSGIDREVGNQLQQVGTTEATTNAGYQFNTDLSNRNAGLSVQEENINNNNAYNKQKLAFVQSGLQSASQSLQSHYARKSQYNILNSIDPNYTYVTGVNGEPVLVPKSSLNTTKYGR